MGRASANPDITILDGGMGRELLRIGAPFRQPEWSALALMEGPDWVERAHRNFLAAGAEVITTSSYACVPFHLGAERFARDGHRLAALAGTLARRAAPAGVRVAGSLPPVLGSYRPERFDPARAGAILDVLVDALAPSVDHWLIETTASIAEAQAALAALAGHEQDRWLSFTLQDRLVSGRARLRSGEPIEAAVAACGGQISALLFNCSRPEVMAAAVAEAVQTADGLRVGVYANAFPPLGSRAEANDGLSRLRPDLDAARYARLGRSWVEAGATIVGGCCGITPAHIAALAGELGSL